MVDQQYEAYRRQYEDTLIHLYELDRPYLVNAMMVDTDINGQTKIYPRIGSLNYNQKTGRNEIASLDEPDYSARHLIITTYYSGTAMDREDVEKMVKNPQDDLYMETVHAIYDAQTAAAMSGFFATVITGEDGGSTSAFNATGDKVVAVNYSGGPFAQNSGAADVGLNIDKLLKVRSLISAANVRVNTTQMNRLNIAVTEDDVQALMANLIGTDNYPMIDQLNQLRLSLNSAVENMVDGMFSWHGYMFHMVPPQFFNLDSSGDRRLPVWIKDGMTYGMKHNVETEIVKLPQTVESIKIQALTRVGALRKHDGKVYEIKVAV